MNFFVSAVLYIGDLFRIWGETLFVIPFENYEMLWLLVPVWLGWFFAEFFQEKVGTSLGNAITNAVLVLWGSIDCSRQTVNFIVNKTISQAWEIALRFGFVALMFTYSIVILVLGIKANKIVKYIGRVRVVTYIFAMYVPVFYNAIPFSWDHFLASILFFPLFYFLIEAIDHIVPDPKVILEDTGRQHKEQANHDSTPALQAAMHTQQQMHQIAQSQQFNQQHNIHYNPQYHRSQEYHHQYQQHPQYQRQPYQHPQYPHPQQYAPRSGQVQPENQYSRR